MQDFDSELINIFSNYRKAEMTALLRSRPELFGSLLQMALSDNLPHSWRASWLLWSVMADGDARVQAHIFDIVQVLPLRKANQQRELLIVLQKLTWPEEIHASLFDTCISIWQKLSHQASLRYNALKMLVKISVYHPVLAGEISYLTEPHYLENLSPGVKNAIFKLIGKGK